MSKKIVLILSGGMDSTTLLYQLLTEGNQVAALTFDYGQKHKKEIQSAQSTIEKVKSLTFSGKLLEHKIADISSINNLIGNSALTGSDIDIPEGHYADENMKLTVVPNRNMIFLSLAIGYAVNIGAHAVSYAAHSGDHTIYPDCRPEFVDKLRQVSLIANYEAIDIHTPFLYNNKSEILKMGLSLNPVVDYSLTWTCYRGEALACGKCGACVERLEAFSLNRTRDPLPYQK